LTTDLTAKIDSQRTASNIRAGTCPQKTARRRTIPCTIPPERRKLKTIPSPTPVASSSFRSPPHSEKPNKIVDRHEHKRGIENEIPSKYSRHHGARSS